MRTDPGHLPPQVRTLSPGTLSPALEPGASAYEAVLRRESARGVFVALDPNVRADLVGAPASYRRRFESWIPHVGLLKVSEDDARRLAPDEPALAAARRWARMGPSAVVLTHGSEGISAVTATGLHVDVPCQQSAVVDTIGAGDTVHAALLHWLHEHDALDRATAAAMSPEQWRSALTFGAAAAAITCSQFGAQPPSAAELTVV